MYQIDLVPTTALAVGLPIPFSNLGSLIPEVLLPYKETENESNGTNKESSVGNGYGDRVTMEFLEALRTNADQIHTYLTKYAEYSQDFPSATFHLLKEQYSSVLSQHKQLIKLLESRRSQQNLTSIASGYLAYMREAKNMCQSVWAKFDDVPMIKGLIILLLAVVVTPLMLLDVGESFSSLHLSCPGLKMGLILALLSPLLARVEMSLFGVLVLLLNFFFLYLTATLLVFVWKFKGMALRSLAGIKWPSLSEINFIRALAVLLLVLHAVSMLSNSFILYEADMLAFFIQSLVVCFALRALSLEFSEQRILGSQLSYSTLSKKVLPHVLLLFCIRLSKIFYACRDLQIQDGCEFTSFIMPLASAAEHLGLLSNVRFVASISALLSVPGGVLVALWWTGYSRHLSLALVITTHVGLPLSVVGVVWHWTVVSLPHDTFLSLPYWQHITPPWVVYTSCTAIAILCVAYPYRLHFLSVMNSEDSVVGEAASLSEEDPLSTSKVISEPLWEAGGVDIQPRQRKKYRGLNINDQGVEVKAPVGLSASIQVAVVTGIQLTALWIPIAMLLNDGIALSATLTAAEMILALSLLQQSEKGKSPLMGLLPNSRFS